MTRGTYTGPRRDLIGKTALVQFREGDTGIFAQFDDLELPKNLTHNWTRFRREDFAITDRDETDAASR